MRRIVRLAATLLLASWAFSAQAAVWYVDGPNCTAPGTGTDVDPFCTVAQAVDAAADGDEIRVLPGTYAECVDATGKALALVADAFDLSDANDVTILDGSGVCDADTAPGSVVALGDGSSLTGFTVTGGGLSGVRAAGSVEITGNIVTGNQAARGGGIFLWSGAGPDQPGTTDAVVDGNVVGDNSASGEGGGIFVRAEGDGGLRREVILRNNTVRNNTAAGSGGGIFVETVSTSTGIVHATLTGNDVSGNAAGDDTFTGSGGGIHLEALDQGENTIVLDANGVRRNTATGDGGGLDVDAAGRTAGSLAVTVSGNGFSANEGRSGGGAAIRLSAEGLPAGTQARVEISGNEFSGNLSSDLPADGPGGAGLLAGLLVRGSPGDAVEMELSRNTFRGNTAQGHGGGATLEVTADSESPGGPTTTTAAVVHFERGLMVENSASQGADDGTGGALALLLNATGDALASTEVNFSTMASNASGAGAGGIGVVAWTAPDTGGTATGRAELEFRNSIVSANDGYGLGAQPAPGSAGNPLITVEYDDVAGNTPADYDAVVGSRTGQSGNISEPPVLDVFYVPETCSPTVDAGDPAEDASAEPVPNGGRVNQGHLGGTETAAESLPDMTGDRLVDGRELLRLAASFASSSGESRFQPEADLDGNGIIDGDDLALVAEYFGRGCE